MKLIAVYSSHALKAVEKDTIHHLAVTGVAFVSELTQQGMWTAGFVSLKRVQCPLVPTGEKIRFVGMISQISREVKVIGLKTRLSRTMQADYEGTG